MKTKINIQYFFEDKNSNKKIKLTQAEAKQLTDFQYDYLLSNGLGSISGGFAQIILKELDEEDSNIILGVIKSGIQDGEEDRVYTDKIIFNRERKTIVFA